MLLGLILGALLGIVFGELVGFLDIVADGYVQLLQMTVLPYVTISLVSGLGSLTFRQAKLLVTKVGSLLLVLWAMAFAILFAMPSPFHPGRRRVFSAAPSYKPTRSSIFSGCTFPAIRFIRSRTTSFPPWFSSALPQESLSSGWTTSTASLALWTFSKTL